MKVYPWHSNDSECAWVGLASDALPAWESQSPVNPLAYDDHIDQVAEPVQLKAFKDEYGNHLLPLSDFPGTGYAYPRVLSQRAYDALAGLLDKYGIFKQAEIDGQPFYLYYPTEINDALDLERSKTTWTFAGYPRLIKPVFKNDATFTPVFILPRFKSQAVFVTDEFVDLARKSNLQGLDLSYPIDPDTVTYTTFP